MILAMAGFAFEDLFIKILSAYFPISEVIIILGFTGSIVFLIIALFQKASIFHKDLLNKNDIAEASIWVNDVSESQLIDLMNSIVKKYPEIKLFSLPKLEPVKTIELGVKGSSEFVNKAIREIQEKIADLGYQWHK